MPSLLERFFSYARYHDALLWRDSASFWGAEREVDIALWHRKSYEDIIKYGCSKKLKNQAALNYIAALKKLEAKQEEA